VHEVWTFAIDDHSVVQLRCANTAGLIEVLFELWRLLGTQGMLYWTGVPISAIYSMRTSPNYLSHLFIFTWKSLSFSCVYSGALCIDYLTINFHVNSMLTTRSQL